MLKNAEAYKSEQLSLCHKYGFEGVHPLNIKVDFQANGPVVATAIYSELKQMMHDCDIILADCNQLRGALMDDGAAYE